MKKLLLALILFYNLPAGAMENTNSFQLQKQPKTLVDKKSRLEYKCINCPVKLSAKHFKGLKDAVRAHHFRCAGLKIDRLVIPSNNGRVVTCKQCKQSFAGDCQRETAQSMFRKHDCPPGGDEVFLNEWENSRTRFFKTFGLNSNDYSFRTPRKFYTTVQLHNTSSPCPIRKKEIKQGSTLHLIPHSRLQDTVTNITPSTTSTQKTVLRILPSINNLIHHNDDEPSKTPKK